MIKINIVCATLCLLLFTLVSCDKLPDEQFQKSVSFTRNGFQSPELNYIDATDMNTSISALVSGTSVLKEDIQLSYVIDPDTLNAYNRANFNLDSSKYYSLLPTDCYALTSMTATIKAGADIGLIPLSITGSKVDKYKNYVLPLRITETSKFKLSKSPYTVEMLNINFVNKYNGTYAITGTLNTSNTSGKAVLKVVNEQTCYSFMGIVDMTKANYKNYYFTMNFNPTDSTVTLGSSDVNNLVSFLSLPLDKTNLRTNFYTESSTLRKIKLSYQFKDLANNSLVTRFDGYLVMALVKKIN